MQLEAQKYYKTATGRQVFAIGKDPNGRWVVAAFDGYLQYDDNGNLVDEDYIRQVSSPENYKIVEEWKEPQRGEFWLVVFSKHGFGQTVHYSKIEAAAQVASLCENGFEIITVKRVSWVEGESDL